MNSSNDLVISRSLSSLVRFHYYLIVHIYFFCLANIFQLTNKSCPIFKLPPVFPRQNCDTDRDCWPRICCEYGGSLNGQKYCRIPLPGWRSDLMKTITKSKYTQCFHPFVASNNVILIFIIYNYGKIIILCPCSNPRFIVYYFN